MVVHGGADGGRSRHGGGNFRQLQGPTNGGDREPKSQDEADDPEGQGGARGFGNRGVGPEGVDPEGGATENWGGTGGKGEPNGARGTEGRSKECSPEVEVGGRGSPAELVDWWALVETRELEAMVEPLGCRTEVESGPRRLKAESRDPPDSTQMELEMSRPAASPRHRWWAEGAKQSREADEIQRRWS